MATMEVHLVSAERELFSGEAQAVYARSLAGEIGILPGHQPALLALAAAPLKVVTDGGEELHFAVHNGFLEFRENRLTVLADLAEPADEIDVARARSSADELRRKLGSEDDAETRAKLARDEARINVAGS